MKPDKDMDALQSVINENRDKFEVEGISDSHSERFLWKLNSRLKGFIDIVPYLLRVTIATFVIFIASVIIWNNFIRHDRHEISLKEKVVLIFSGLRNSG